ncbi:MAG: hypothetical protein ABI690_22800 [Chloroflexota bacterium]
MAIHVSWDDAEKTTIMYTIDGRWTWSDLYDALDLGRDLMDSVSHEHIDFIVDMTSCKLMPDNALSHFARMSNKPHPKSRHMVMAGATSFVRALLNIMGRYQGTDARAKAVSAVATVEEARALLAAQQQDNAETD